MKNFLPLSSRVIKNNKGLSFIEVIISGAIFLTLIGAITINLLNLQRNRSAEAVVSVLNADLKSQQIKAMSGNTQNTITADEYGIFFESDKYTLFKGETYAPGSESNFEMSLSGSLMIIDINLQNSQVIFEQGSGEVKNYTEEQNSITILDTQTSETRTLSINQYGISTVN